MITKLTKEQKDKIPLYLNKALESGLKTDSIDRSAAEIAAKEIGEFLGYKIKTIEFHDSPLACQRRSQEIIGNKTFDSQFWSGLYWSGYYTYYKYIRDELFPDRKAEFPLLDKVLSWIDAIHYTQFVDGVFLISERPVKIERNERGLHCETGKALEYKDGWGIYSINGVRLNGCEFFFDSSIDNTAKAKKIMAVENVEQRSELIRTFGMAKIYELLDYKVLDSRNDGYELLLLDVGSGRKEEYLKMVNPSTGEIHVECVGKSCKTIEEALESRVPERLRNKYGYKEAIARS